MDYGESESVILYEKLGADFLLIDDNKARIFAESLNVNCIGSVGLLFKAKKMGLIRELKPIFLKLLEYERYFSKKLLNLILIQAGEEPWKTWFPCAINQKFDKEPVRCLTIGVGWL